MRLRNRCGISTRDSWAGLSGLECLVRLAVGHSDTPTFLHLKFIPLWRTTKYTEILTYTGIIMIFVFCFFSVETDFVTFVLRLLTVFSMHLKFFHWDFTGPAHGGEECPVNFSSTSVVWWNPLKVSRMRSLWGAELELRFFQLLQTHCFLRSSLS